MVKKMRVIIFAALAVCVLGGNLFAQPAGSPVAKHGQLSVQNGKIVDKNGDPVALRGMSFYWDRDGWDGYQFYTAAAVNKLADEWKVDIIRAAFSGPQGNISRIKTVVDAAIAKGIYVILDYHSHNAHGEEPTAQSFFNTFLNDANYVGKPNILYEIYNEPVGESYEKAGDHWRTIKPYMQRMVTLIRGKDAKNIILVGTPWYCLRVDVAAADPPTGTNLAYVFHFYAADELHDIPTKSGVITMAVNDRKQAVYVSEFGTSEASGKGKISTEKTKNWFELLDRLSIGWCNWSVSANEESAVLSSGGGDATSWTTRNPGGTFIRNELISYGTNTYKINVAVEGNQGGKVESVPASSNYTYQRGTPVTLTAVPAAGWTFDRWTGASTSTKATITLDPLYSNVTTAYTAVFVEGSMISNGTFTSDIVGWLSSGVTISHDNASLKAVVTAAGAHVRQQNLSLQKGRKYELSFKARASQGSGSVTPRVTDRTRGTDYLPNPAATALTAQMQEIKRTFDMCAADDNTAALVLECTNGMTWYLDDVKMNDVGAAAGCNTAVQPLALAGHRTSWSVSRTGGALQLRGPADIGARVSFYDVRGKLVRSMAASDGLTLGSGVPAGNYVLVVKNRAGGEVLRTRVVMAK